MRRLSPRELRRLSRRFGLTFEELEGVEEVLIKLHDKQLVIKEPHVLVMKISGQRVFQVMGEVEEIPVEEKPPAIEIKEKDVQLVAAQAGVSLEEARKALEATKGDLAAAIIMLQESKRMSRQSS